MMIKPLADFFSICSVKLRWLLRLLYKIPPLIVLGFILAGSTYWATFLPQLNFNYNIESFFSSEDPEVEIYQTHRATFENENDYVLIGLKNNQSLFEYDFLKQVDSLSKSLEELPNIKKVYSPTKIKEVVKSRFGSMQIPIIHLEKEEKYPTDRRRIYENGLYVNTFFSPDTQSVSLLLKKEQNMNKSSNDLLLKQIENKINRLNFEESHIAGRIRTQNFYVKKMSEQMGLFSLLASLLFITALFIIFRKPTYVILSFLMVVIALVWIFGIISSMGIKLDLMLTMLPTLIFIISTSAGIHLISKFRENYHHTSEKNQAIKFAVQHTGLPNFLNALTTSIGFASLSMIPVMPIQRFGLLVAMGILLSFFVGLPFIVSMLRIIPLRPFKGLSKRKITVSDQLIDRLLSRPKTTILVTLVLLSLSLFFIGKIKINTHFLDDLEPNAELMKDLQFFEANFSGIRPFELNIRPTEKGELLSYKTFRAIDTLEHYLKTQYGVGFLFSPLTVIKGLNKATHGGNNDYFRLPKNKNQFNRLKKTADRQKLWNNYLPVLSKEQNVARLSGRTKDEGSYVFEQRNKELKTFIAKECGALKVRITGAAHLMDNANRHIAWNLAKGMGLAIGITTLIIFLFTLSFRIALISLIPNLIPMILVGGFMGVAEVPLKVATALIFTIAYGIAVDDTIHFLNSYRLQLKETINRKQAVKSAIHKMWRPMLYTSSVLFAGFMIFTLSQFKSISLLGFLVSGSLFAALIADLLLLPIILKLKIN